MQISVNNLILATLGAALLAWSFAGVNTDELKRPNVLMIMIDTVRADHLGSYGYDKPTSPFLDSLFETGVVFERAYAPAYLTFQTDASILSGLYPSQNNVRTWTTPIRDDVRLLPEIFQLYGYETHMVAWSGLREYFGLTRGFDTYTIHRGGNLFEKTSRQVLDTIAASSQPYFIYWTIYDVHVPMPFASSEFAPPEYSGLFARQLGFLWPGQSVTDIEYYHNDTVSRHRKTESDAAYVRAQYDTGIRNVDDGLRAVFDELDARGDLNNTIVVVSAQHGEDLGEHGFFFHRDVYENGIHVPLAIVYPEQLRPRRVAEPVSLIDLAPTLTELAGLTRFEGGQGSSLVPLLRNEGSKEIKERVLFVERQPFKEVAVIDWPWKLIYRDAARGAEGLSGDGINDFMRALRKNDVALSHELYNLTADPGETDNLFDIYESRAIQDSLMSLVKDFRERSATALRMGEVTDISDEQVLFTYP